MKKYSVMKYRISSIWVDQHGEEHLWVKKEFDTLPVLVEYVKKNRKKLREEGLTN